MAGVSRVTDRPSRVGAGRGAPPLLREAIGRVLREERTDRDERLVDVARQASISPQYLSEIERGAKDPSSEVLRSVSGALGLHPSEVVRRASAVMAGIPRRTLEGRLPAPARRGHLHALPAVPGRARAPRAASTEPVVLLAA